MKTILRNFLSVLRRFKMATALNVLGLSAAFAAFLIIMMQVDFDRNFDRSHPEADHIFRVESYGVTGDSWSVIIARPFADAFIRSSSHIVAGAYENTVWGKQFISVETDGRRSLYEEQILSVSEGYTDVFTFDMVEGSERALGEPEKALIPLSLARKFFAGEPAVGKRLSVEIHDDAASLLTVGGVYRDFPRNSSTRNAVYRLIPKDLNLDRWDNWSYTFYIRVDAPENAEGLFENFKKTFDLAAVGREYMNFRTTPLLQTHYIENVSYDQTPKASPRTLFILTGIALVIVLIAGINYMNFSAALAPKRIRSINTQKVFGSSDGAIRIALLAEAVAVSLAAFLIAVWIVAIAKNTSLASLVEADLSLAAHPPVVLSTAGIALLTGLLAGIYPARYMTSFQPAITLKGSFGLSPHGRALRSVLMGIQFTASFALVIGTLFMYLQNRFMLRSDLGYDREALIVTDVNASVNTNRDAFTNRHKSFAGVENVTYSEYLLASDDKFMGWGRPYRDRMVSFQCLPVEPSFLEVMGIRVSEGRNFRPEDALTENGAFIFNETARDKLELVLNEHVSDTEIIGFMPDLKFASLRVEVEPMAFFVWGTDNWGRSPNVSYIKVASGADLHAAIEHVRATLKEFDDEYPFNVRFFDQVLQQTYENEQAFGRLISLFSLVAILISIVGVFGLVVFDSEYRRKEISLRKIFGSTTGGILLLFNKAYLRLLIPCFVVAAPPAWYAVDRWLENFAYRTPLYWWVYPSAFVLVGLLTIATVTFQNWRAANANPAEGIKSE